VFDGRPPAELRARARGRRRPFGRLRVCTLPALLVGCCGIVACGEQAPGSGAAAIAKVSPATKPRHVDTSAAPVQPQPNDTGRPGSPPASAVARVDASSDRVLAEGKVHIAPGAPSDAEIRREIQAARKAGVVLQSGNSAASFEAAQSSSGGATPEIQTPETPWNPRSKPIADWIVSILQWASQHGWTGTVTSGYRTYYEQAQLNSAGAYSAPAGLSNHETATYPGGAVDVTEPGQLIGVLRGYPGEPKLVGGVLGPVDPEHFSATGD
jgi:hypothetical protein